MCCTYALDWGVFCFSCGVHEHDFARSIPNSTVKSEDAPAEKLPQTTKANPPKSLFAKGAKRCIVPSRNRGKDQDCAVPLQIFDARFDQRGGDAFSTTIWVNGEPKHATALAAGDLEAN